MAEGHAGKLESLKLPQICFPWIIFGVHTIMDRSFWLYMYYSFNRSDIPSLQGVIEYRMHVSDWGVDKFEGKGIYQARFDEDGTAWFLCDRFEKICKTDQRQLILSDFEHKYHKSLGSSMRNSIPPVICKAKIMIVDSYPR
jgi:hypothetical protein